MNLFPEYKHADKCAIVGFAPSSRASAPYDDRSWDVWGLNEALTQPWFMRKDPQAWFQIHPKFDFMRLFNRNDRTHWTWLQQDHPFPIFMQYNFKDVPNAVRYPLEDAIDLTGEMYFTSSPAYMVALAILMGYEEIGIWGIEMAADSEYAYQKPCMEYWLGIAKGRGIKVTLPPECALLHGNLYAYEDLRAADVTYYGQRRGANEDVLTARKTLMNQWNGRRHELMNLMSNDIIKEHPDVRRLLVDLYQERTEEFVEKVAEASAVDGAVEELGHIMRWHNSQNIASTREMLKARITDVQA